MSTFQDVADHARNVYLNDASATIYNNTRMFFWLKAAQAELLDHLGIVNDQIFREITAVNYIANAATLAVSGLDKPVFLEERPSTSTSTTDYRPVEERMWELGDLISENLKYWAWREGGIAVLPASTDRTVRVYYDKIISLPAAIGDPITSESWFDYLAAQASYLASMFGGNNPSRAAQCKLEAEGHLDQIQRLSVKKLQSLPVKRRPYRGRRPYVTNS